jgi:RNA polymerase sigma-70 factor, ECF subfamily
MRGAPAVGDSRPTMSALSLPLPRHHRILDPDAAADHHSRLVALAWSLCGSRHLAEELTQETYARVLARPRRLRGGSDFHYLARTLRNVISDHWRAERRQPATIVGLDDIDEPAAVGDPETAALANEVFAAMADLPEHLRDVIAAVDLAGLSYAEAAKALQIPNGTVMSRLYRARERLTNTLAVTTG